MTSTDIGIQRQTMLYVNSNVWRRRSLCGLMREGYHALDCLV